jgi:hypothetical protein
MRPMIILSDALLMRIFLVPKPVMTAVLGCLILTGCGAHATAAHAPTGGTMSADLTADEAELRFLDLATRIAQGCAPGAPTPGDSQVRPRSSTPSGTPNADGDIPVPVDSEPTPDSTLPVQVEEIALSGVEVCSGEEHVKLVGNAFKGTGAASYQRMADTLTELGYPAARIHEMPEHSGFPRVRLDLRTMGSRLALEVTATGSGVVAEAFGMSELEDVHVTEVRR